MFWTSPVVWCSENVQKDLYSQHKPGGSRGSNDGNPWRGQQARTRTQLLTNSLIHTHTHKVPAAVLSVLYSGEDDAYRDWLHSQMIQQRNCSVSYDPSLGTFSVSDYPGCRLYKPLKQQVILVQHAFLSCAWKCAILSAYLVSTWYAWPLELGAVQEVLMVVVAV